MESYKAAGVSDALAEQNFGKPWKEWGEKQFEPYEASNIHNIKRRLYRDTYFDMYATETPFAETILDLTPLVITGASRESVDLVGRKLNRNLQAITGLSIDDKIEVLASVRPGFYFEDDPEAAKAILNHTDWRVILCES